MHITKDVFFKGKRALIRVDFNVPLNAACKITDDSRIVSALPTIKRVISDGGMAIIMSHLGRPKNGVEDRFSLKHVVNHLSSLMQHPVKFINDCVGESAISSVAKMKNGDILILENLRFYAEEKNGDEGFAKKLASLADIYINDAFGTAHRAHASTSIIANFFPKKKYLGLLLNHEINTLNRLLTSPKRPFTAIIGGAKISGKIDVITALFEKVDALIIGGGMAYTFARAMGGNIGMSLVEENKLGLAKELISLAKKRNVELLLPVDSLNADSFNNNAKTNISNILDIPSGYIGLDIASNSIKTFCNQIKKSKTIIWNGPMGVFEIAKFETGTKKIAEAICFATQNGAFSLIGGGDSVAAIKQFSLEKSVSYLSTGGGALLEYLEGKSLPGIISLLD